jgi:thiamine biosynthesis lipoprotein
MVRVASNAMATRFEIALPGDNSARLRAAGEAALAEVERIEAQLSIFRPTSELARVNANAAHEPVRVSPSVFHLLEQACQLSHQTKGAFDITIAPLVRCWGFMQGTGAWPDPATIAKAQREVGMQHVILDPANLTVRFDREGVMLDLGAIGKGYAIDQAAEGLREAGVTSALLHGGTSTVYGLGEEWKVAIESPPNGDEPPQLLATVPLQDEAMSVSAVWGKSFEHEGKTYGHVLDPRTGFPASTAVLAAVVLSSATETDALSTALLVEGIKSHELFCRLRKDMRSLVIEPDGVISTGIVLKTGGNH